MPEGDKPNPLELKEQGNQAYRDGDYDKAIAKYTEVNYVVFEWFSENCSFVAERWLYVNYFCDYY